QRERGTGCHHVLGRHLGRTDRVYVEVDHHRPVAVLHTLEREGGGHAHAELVRGRGRQREAQLAQGRALAGIQLAKAHEGHVRGLDGGRGRGGGEGDGVAAPEGEGQRHAV